MMRRISKHLIMTCWKKKSSGSSNRIVDFMTRRAIKLMNWMNSTTFQRLLKKYRRPEASFI